MKITNNTTELLSLEPCKFTLTWIGNGFHLNFEENSLVELVCLPNELARILGNDDLHGNVGCFLVEKIPVSSIHAALILDFCHFRDVEPNQTLDIWLEEEVSGRLLRGLGVIGNLLGDQMPRDLILHCNELHLSDLLQSEIAEINSQEARREGREILSASELAGAISNDEEISKGFKVVSSGNIELWGPHTNYGLAYDGRVLLETELDPVFIARLLGIPSQSSETIDLLIQMYEYPLTSIEAYLFASFSAYVCDDSNVDREDVFEAWSMQTFEEKMHSGFELLSQVLGRTNAEWRTGLSCRRSKESDKRSMKISCNR